MWDAWLNAGGLLALALVAFFDCVIGIGFFVWGEVAFLAAGAAAVAEGSIVPVVVVMVSAWAGDLTSYYLGRRYGKRMLLRALRPVKRRRAYRKAGDGLKKRAFMFIVVSRLLGPVAWITPYLAGALAVRTRVFAPSSFLGVVLGAGQFCLFGAFGVHLYEFAQAKIVMLASIAWAHIGVIAIFSVLVAGTIAIFRASRINGTFQFSLSVLFCMTVLGLSNLVYFFGTNAHAVVKAAPVNETVCSLAEQPFLVRPGETSLHLPQPVNLVVIGAEVPALMQKLGWQRNQSFTHDKITLSGFLTSLRLNLLPVSEMYWRGRPADLAYQLPGTLAKRLHVRWWRAGSDQGRPLWVGAISRDEEFAVKYYRAIPALLHDINPGVDKERDLFANSALDLGYSSALAPIGMPVNEGSALSDYETDGRVKVISPGTESLTQADLQCLKIASESEV